MRGLFHPQSASTPPGKKDGTESVETPREQNNRLPFRRRPRYSQKRGGLSSVALPLGGFPDLEAELTRLFPEEVALLLLRLDRRAGSVRADEHIAAGELV